jgi:hypothetical protein
MAKITTRIAIVGSVLAVLGTVGAVAKFVYDDRGAQVERVRKFEDRYNSDPLSADLKVVRDAMFATRKDELDHPRSAKSASDVIAKDGNLQRAIGDLQSFYDDVANCASMSLFGCDAGTARRDFEEDTLELYGFAHGYLCKQNADFLNADQRPAEKFFFSEPASCS